MQGWHQFSCSGPHNKMYTENIVRTLQINNFLRPEYYLKWTVVIILLFRVYREDTNGAVKSETVFYLLHDCDVNNILFLCFTLNAVCLQTWLTNSTFQPLYFWIEGTKILINALFSSTIQFAVCIPYDDEIYVMLTQMHHCTLIS